MEAFRSEELFGAEAGPTGRCLGRSLPLANKAKSIVDPVFAFALMQESVYAALWKKLVSGVVGVGGWWLAKGSSFKFKIQSSYKSLLVQARQPNQPRERKFIFWYELSL